MLQSMLHVQQTLFSFPPGDTSRLHIQLPFQLSHVISAQPCVCGNEVNLFQGWPMITSYRIFLAILPLSLTNGEDFNDIEQWFSTGGNPAPSPRDIWQFLETFWLPMSGT